MSEKNTFEFSYSTKEQDEIRKIREKYIPQEENKLEQLRRLDASATTPATIAALTLGTVSALVLGVGMCCTMVWAGRLFVPGIAIGLVGLAGLALIYPLYAHMTKKRRAKLAPEILRLTEELSRGK